jgi:hypothetical protein
MTKFIKYSACILSIFLITIAGCTKIDPEITTVNVSRLFSPVGLDARVVNKTSIRLTWDEVRNATSYDIELFDNGNLDFSGTPQKSVTGVTFDQLPFTITELDGETDYSVRVKAVGDSIDDSKWVTATFKTDAEQIFLPVDVADIEATGVVLKWTPGLAVTQIVLTPGDITHDITPDEAAAGAAEITGLTGETDYTAKISNGAKVRGTITFTTLIDLGGATQVNPGDDLAAILAAAADGDVLALMPGEYTVPELSIDKSISIKGARPADKPVLISTILHVKTGAALSLKDLVMDGTGSSGDQALVYDDDGNNGALSIEDCEIKNYTKGVIYVNKATNLASVLFKGNIIHDIECNGGDFIDFRKGLTPSFTFMNNTVYNSALSRDLFRMDSGGSDNFPGVKSVITISNNTFNKVCDNTGKRILYIRLGDNEITFTKNIIANTQGYYTNQSSTTIKTMSDNNYFNAPNFTASTNSGAQNDTGTYTTLDPGFANPDNGDFTISNDELKFQQIGDPRWIK